MDEGYNMEGQVEPRMVAITVGGMEGERRNGETESIHLVH